MRKIMVPGIAALLLFSFTGCMTVPLSSGSVYKPIAMSGNINKKFNVIKHFKSDFKSWFTLFNLVQLNDPKVTEILNNELNATQGDAIINVKLEGQTTFVDGLIPVIVGVIGTIAAPPYGGYASSLIGARTYTVEGDVVKYAE
jgi:hypothetical protein